MALPAFMLAPYSGVRIKKSFEPHAGPIAQRHLDEANELYGNSERMKRLVLAISLRITSNCPWSVSEEIISESQDE